MNRDNIFKEKPVEYVVRKLPLKDNYMIVLKYPNGLVVKVRFLFNSDHIKMGIGFSDVKNNKFPYENWVSKDIVRENKRWIIKDSLIQHPPYRFYAKKIGKLFELYNNIFEKASISNSLEKFEYNHPPKQRDEDKIYYFCTMKSNNISKKNEEKIIRTCGYDFSSYLRENNLTAKFTNDIEKSKIPRIN